MWPLQVVHPGVEENVNMDMAILEAVGRTLDCIPFLRTLDFPSVFHQFHRLLICQVRPHLTYICSQMFFALL